MGFLFVSTSLLKLIIQLVSLKINIDYPLKFKLRSTVLKSTKVNISLLLDELYGFGILGHDFRICMYFKVDSELLGNLLLEIFTWPIQSSIMKLIIGIHIRLCHSWLKFFVDVFHDSRSHLSISHLSLFINLLTIKPLDNH